MWGDLRFADLTRLLGRWMLRWLETLGENPPPARDHGLCAWQYLRQSTGWARPAGPAPDGHDIVDDPCFFLSIGV